METASSNVQEDEKLSRRKKRKLHTYEKARLAYENIVKAKERKKEAEERREHERQEAISRSKMMKKEKTRILQMRTKKGQPKLDQQVEFLLKKIERSVAPVDEKKMNTKSRR